MNLHDELNNVQQMTT